MVTEPVELQMFVPALMGGMAERQIAQHVSVPPVPLGLTKLRARILLIKPWSVRTPVSATALRVHATASPASQAELARELLVPIVVAIAASV